MRNKKTLIGSKTLITRLVTVKKIEYIEHASTWPLWSGAHSVLNQGLGQTATQAVPDTGSHTLGLERPWTKYLLPLSPF